MKTYFEHNDGGRPALDVVEFTPTPKQGIAAVIAEDVPVVRLVRALAAEGLALSADHTGVLIHAQEASRV